MFAQFLLTLYLLLPTLGRMIPKWDNFAAQAFVALRPGVTVSRQVAAKPISKLFCSLLTLWSLFKVCRVAALTSMITGSTDKLASSQHLTSLVTPVSFFYEVYIRGKKLRIKI